MGSSSLVTEEIVAGEKFVREFDKYKPVRAAFWLKEGDDPHRYLHITSDEIDIADVRAAYSEVVRLASQMETPFFDAFRVKIVPMSRPLAREAADMLDRFPSTMATRLAGRMFGGVFVDDVYLYPPLHPAAAV